MLKKLKALRAAGFILFSIFSFQAFAETYLLSGNYYLRSSMDFLSSNNKIGVLQEGSTFRVVNRFPRRNGAEALEIQVTAMSRGSYLNPSPTERLFIYKPARTKDFQVRSGPHVEAGVAKCDNCGNQWTEDATTVLTPISDTVMEMQNIAPAARLKQGEEDTPTSPIGPPRHGNLDNQIRKYSDSTEVSRMIEWAMKNKKPASRGLCYRSVKEAMATQCGPTRKGHSCRNPFSEGGKKGPGNNLTTSVSTEMADSYALSAKVRLKEHGFVNLLEIEPYKKDMHSASSAPKGAILVYSSGIPCGKNRDCGHTEIKVGNTGEAGYVSDYYSKDPINETPRARKYGSNYKLVGIMIKPKGP